MLLRRHLNRRLVDLGVKVFIESLLLLLTVLLGGSSQEHAGLVPVDDEVCVEFEVCGQTYRNAFH